MRKTKLSDSYVDIQAGLEHTLYQTRALRFWRFQYASVHACQNHYQELVALSPTMDEMMHKYRKIYMPESSFENNEQTIHFYDFVYKLIKSWHLCNLPINYTDLNIGKYEPHIVRLNILNDAEEKAINRLHDISYNYGFFIVELCQSDYRIEDILKDIDNSGPQSFSSSIIDYPIYDFFCKPIYPPGFQTSLINHHNRITEDWDLVVKLNRNTKVDHIRTALKKAWPNKGKQDVGERDGHEFEVYLDRSNCTLNQAIDNIRLQLKQFEYYETNLTIPLAVPSDMGEYTPRHKKSKVALHELSKHQATATDLLKSTHGLTKKRRCLYKDNVRRAVGLLLIKRIEADKNTNIEQQAKQLIGELRKSAPDSLTVFYSNYFKPVSKDKSSLLGDTETAMTTVVSEMRREYNLAKLCISKAEYLSHSDLKNTSCSTA